MGTFLMRWLNVLIWFLIKDSLIIKIIYLYIEIYQKIIKIYVINNLI